MERVKLNIKRPYIAFPTLILSFFAFIFWMLMFYLRLYHNISPLITLPVSSLMTYVSFTPLHDSLHNSVSRNKIINYIPSLFSGIQFFICPPTYFKLLHDTHHKFTNDPKKDPDYYCSSSFTICLPFKWLTHTLHYFYFFFTHKELYKNRIYHMIYWIAFVWTLPFLFLKSNDFMILWFIPSQLATIVTIYMFDYVPHKPHNISIYENKYQCTNVIDTIFDERLITKKIPNESFILSVLTLNQSYHSIHHLYPYLPFYMYHKVWIKHKSFFVKKGVQEVSLI